MKKEEFIKTVAEKSDISQKQTAEIIQNILDSIKTAVVEKNESITFLGFGSFSSTVRKERSGINPATKEKINIPERKVVKFKPSKEGWL